VHTSRIETLSDVEIRSLFNDQRNAEYRDLDKIIDGLDRKVQSSRRARSPASGTAFPAPCRGQEDL